MIWKDVPGYEHFYEVSDEGLVRNWSTWKVLQQRVFKDGGCYVSLYGNHEGSKTLPVHRLVAKAFIENPEGFKNVKHKDGNKKNNSAGNLYWSNVKQKTKETKV
jgi:hypothetical protein